MRSATTRYTADGPTKGVKIPSGIIFASFILVNLALKLPFLASQPIALDEPFSIFHAQQTLPEMFEVFQRENNPPFHFLVLHVFIGLFGIGAWSVRLPSLIFSCLAAGMLFRSGERHFGRFSGIAAASIFTLSNFHLFHAHEARTYALFTLLTVLALDRFLRLADDPSRTRNYLVLGLWNALLIYTHFLGFWVILAQGLGFFLLSRKAAVWWRLGLSWLMSGILFLPFVYLLLSRLEFVQTSGTWVWEPHWSELYGNINRFLNGKLGTLAFGAVLAMGAVVWLMGKNRKIRLPDWLRERKTLMVALFFGLIYFGMFAISFLLTPVFLDRYLLFATVPLFLLMGRAMDGIFTKQALKWAALGMMVVGMGINLNLNPSNERPIHELFARISMEKRADVPLVVCPPFREWMVLYHLDREAFRDYRNKEQRMRELSFLCVNYAVDIPDSLTRREKLIYFDADSQFTHPDNGILEKLRGRYAKEEVFAFGDLYRLHVFEN